MSQLGDRVVLWGGSWVDVLRHGVGFWWIQGLVHRRQCLLWKERRDIALKSEGYMSFSLKNIGNYLFTKTI